MDSITSIPDGGVLKIPKKEEDSSSIDLLIESTLNGNYDTAKSLLLKGIKPTSTTTNNINSAYYCALIGKTNEYNNFLELLLSSYRCSPNEELGRYPNITIPLILVISLPEIHIQILLNRVNLLLDKGADINGVDSNGKNPLHHAILRIGANLEGVVALIHLLLKRGASVTTILSPLKVSLKLMQNTTVPEELANYEAIIKLLVSYGCQLTKITRNDIACLSNQTKDFIKSSAHRQMMHYPLLQGSMKKLSPFFSFWNVIKLYQDRYYVIQNDGSLYYYKSKYDFETGGLPKGCIEKDDYNTALPNNGIEVEDNILKISVKSQEGRVFHLKMYNNDEATLLSNAINSFFIQDTQGYNCPLIPSIITGFKYTDTTTYFKKKDKLEVIEKQKKDQSKDS